MQGTLPKEIAEAIDDFGISYEILPCDPEFADTSDFCAKYGFPITHCGNTIVVASKREPVQYATCTVQGSDRLDVNKTVRKLMGVSRLSFASKEQTAGLTGMVIGGVTPFALPDTVPVYFDQKLMDLDYIILGSGDRSSKIMTSPTIFNQIHNSIMVAGLSISKRQEA